MLEFARHLRSDNSLNSPIASISSATEFSKKRDCIPVAPTLPGTAVSQVKIKGVLHEFSSLPGVKEDVTEIVMNIKDLCIKNNSTTNEPKVAYIDASGDKVVTAGDIQVDADLEILNPDLVIANLSGPEASLLLHPAEDGRRFSPAITTVMVARAEITRQ